MQHYSQEEDVILLKNYGKFHITELLRLLPNRTEYSVRNRYSRLTGRKQQRSECVSRRRTAGWDRNDEYLNQMFHDFCMYIVKSRSILKNSHSKPDVQCMMNTFRDVYKRKTDRVM